MKKLVITGLCAIGLLAAQAQKKAKPFRYVAAKQPYTAAVTEGKSFKSLLAMHLGVDEQSLEPGTEAPATAKTAIPAELSGYTVLAKKAITGPQGEQLWEYRLGKLPLERKYAYVAADGNLLALTDKRQTMDQTPAVASVRY